MKMERIFFFFFFAGAVPGEHLSKFTMSEKSYAADNVNIKI